MQSIGQRPARREPAWSQPERHHPGVYDDALAHVTDHSMTIDLHIKFVLNPNVVSSRCNRSFYVN